MRLRSCFKCSCDKEFEMTIHIRRIENAEFTQSAIDYLMKEGLQNLVKFKSKKKAELRIEEGFQRISIDPIASLEL